MRPSRRLWPRLLVVAAAPLLSLAAAWLSPTATEAQNPPATYYGFVSPGDQIEARRDGAVCGQSVAAGDGFWLLTLPGGGPCALTEGATIHFAMNGTETPATERWRSGGVPADVNTGVQLSAGTPPPKGSAAVEQAPVFEGAIPPADASALLVTSKGVAREALRDSLKGKGCALQAFAVLQGGQWSVYIEGAPTAVNSGFPASMPGLAAFFVRC